MVGKRVAVQKSKPPRPPHPDPPSLFHLMIMMRRRRTLLTNLIIALVISCTTVTRYLSSKLCGQTKIQFDTRLIQYLDSAGLCKIFFNSNTVLLPFSLIIITILWWLLGEVKEALLHRVEPGWLRVSHPWPRWPLAVAQPDCTVAPCVEIIINDQLSSTLRKRFTKGDKKRENCLSRPL